MPSIQETVAAAVDAGGPDDAPEVEPVETESAPEPVVASGGDDGGDDGGESESAAAQRARDEAGRFAKAPKESKKPAPPRAGQGKADGIGAPPPVPSATPVPVPGVTTQTPVEPTQVKAPASMTLAEREAFAKAPPEVQRFLDRREKDQKRLVDEHAEYRKKWGAVEQAAQPYEAMIRGQGGDPARGYASYLQTHAALTHGAPTDKAQLVAKLITQYLPGEEGVRLLASALDGTPPPQSQGQQQYLTPQQAEQMMQQQWQRMISQSHEAQAQKAREAFAATHEWLQDERLGPQVQKLMETMRAAGIAADDESAYRSAIAAHPEIAPVEQQRQAAKAAANAQASTQRAKAAASSVKGSPAAQMNGAQPKGIRAQVEAAFNALERG